MKPKHIPWYSSYETVLEQMKAAQHAFQTRCSALGQESNEILAAFQRDLLARTVHESNWQEGVELDYGRTKELAEIAMDDLRFPEDGRLDLESLAHIHRTQIIEMKRKRVSPEEIATVSLARAHTLLTWIAEELSFRQAASLAFSITLFERFYAEQRAAGTEVNPSIERGLQIVADLKKNHRPAYGPLQGSIGTEGELLTRLLEGKFEVLLNPMDIRYVHGLHRIAMMGVIPSNQLGRWRQKMVHVDNNEVIFPPPETINSLMVEYCTEFPPFISTAKYDPIQMAARISYKFVRIHPYIDGNGRVSRLLMNLVLCRHHPMVSLAPRAKERHRYRQAIRRADRGKLEPLACLIGIAIRDTYRRMLDALGSARAK